jgi:hypothetical protein
VSIKDEELLSEDTCSSNASCKSLFREAFFLQKEFAAAEQPFGWSDVSQKPNEGNVVIMRKLSNRNQHHLSLLRSLRTSQVHLVHLLHKLQTTTWRT